MQVRSTNTRISRLYRLLITLASPSTVTSTSLGLILALRESWAKDTTSTGRFENVRSSVLPNGRDTTGETRFWIAILTVNQMSVAKAREKSFSQKSLRTASLSELVIWQY